MTTHKERADKNYVACITRVHDELTNVKAEKRDSFTHIKRKHQVGTYLKQALEQLGYITGTRMENMEWIGGWPLSELQFKEIMDLSRQLHQDQLAAGEIKKLKQEMGVQDEPEPQPAVTVLPVLDGTAREKMNQLNASGVQLDLLEMTGEQRHLQKVLAMELGQLGLQGQELNRQLEVWAEKWVNLVCDVARDNDLAIPGETPLDEPGPGSVSGLH